MSNSTNVSDIFNQKLHPHCWMYSSTNVCLKFITQVFYCYHSNRQYFEGKERKGKNSFFEMRDSIKSRDFNPQSGTDRRTILFVYLCGHAMRSFMNDTDERRIAYKKGTTAVRKRMQEEMDDGFIVFRSIRDLVVSFKKFNVADCKDIFKNYLFISNKYCFPTICNIFLYLEGYINEYKINLQVAFRTVNTPTSPDNIIKKLLNQNLYFDLTMDYFKNSDCAECVSTSIYNKNNTGVKKMETPNDEFHSMTCIGYDKTVNSLIIKNSYDSDWCESGMFFLKSLDCINYWDINFIDSNLPEYKYLNKTPQLFKPGIAHRSSSSSSIWHARPTVVKNIKEITSRYGTRRMNLGTSVVKTKKRCPKGYTVDKKDKSLCNKK